MLRPIKIRILEIVNQFDEIWNYDIISKISSEYNITTDIGKSYLNFDIVELSVNGLIEDIEQKIDETGKYKKEFLLHKYKITENGRNKIMNLN